MSVHLQYDVKGTAMESFPQRLQWSAAYEDWERRYHETGAVDWTRYPTVRLDATPASPGVVLAESSMLFVSSAGGYLPGTQAAFDASNVLGDYSIRRIPLATSQSEYAYAHEHYEHAARIADAQVLLPIAHLLDLQDAGAIGEVAGEVVSYMGYQPDVRRIIDETIPAIVAVAQELRVQVAFLVPS
jgi:hypothetical protein